jgi:preprotein translocase subunit SecA
VRHEVLNAKNHAREAAIVAKAGRKGAITVATNMAGRGTDIKLGGNPDEIAENDLRSRGLDPVEHVEDWAEALPQALERAEKAVAAEFEEVKDLGGLYVLGTERHESRRIDNQLRGRSGRQGDPGESRFYLSLGDDLMRLFKAQMVERVMAMANVPDEVPIENRMVTRAIASAQGQVEQQNFEIRKNVLKYDEVLNRQREVIYSERRRVLEGEDLHEQVRFFMDDTIEAYVHAETVEGFAEEWDMDRLWGAFKQLYPVAVTVDELVETVGDREGLTPEFIAESVKEDVHKQYDKREEELGSEVMRELERRVVLSVLDRKWREHLYEMDYLQEGIGLRAMAQRDPVVEFQREGFDMFTAMMEGIKEESVGYLFNLEVQVEKQVEQVPVQGGAKEEQVAQEAVPAGAPRSGQSAGGAARPAILAKGLETPKRADRLHFSAPTVDSAGGVVEGDFGADADGGTARSRPTSAGSGAGTAGTGTAAAAAASGEPGQSRAERRKAQKGRRRKK